MTDAEVFQEILHRYGAIGRRDAVQPAFDALRGIGDEVFPVAEADVFAAKDIFSSHNELSARAMRFTCRPCVLSMLNGS